MTKIMLVEDDKSLREIYGIRLIAEGYDVKSANDGEEGLAMVIKEKPDLIISDVMMPKISGFDMLDILRATPETKDVKVIMMTALSSDDQRTRGESLGANRYLVKSQVGIEDVVRTVHEVLGDAPVTASTSINSFGPLAPSSTPSTPANEATTAPAASSVTSEPTMPQPTAPFSSPAPASLGDVVMKNAEVDTASDADTQNAQPSQAINVNVNMPVDAAPIIEPVGVEIAPTMPVAPAPAVSIPVTTPNVATPAQNVAPTPSVNAVPSQSLANAQPFQSPQPVTPQQSAQDIASMIAKELGDITPNQQ